MRIIPLIFTLFLILQKIPCIADTFIVTNNADSGPGSLRQAILSAEANGITGTDYIHFNIPDLTREGRTILLSTGLPNLSSNLVIDGSTQPGTTIAAGEAKVVLMITTRQTSVFTFLSIRHATNVSVYGLYLLNTAYVVLPDPVYRGVYGINLYRSSNISIGAPGKGNSFRGMIYALISRLEAEEDRPLVNCENINIQSNLFNLDESGTPTILHPFTMPTGSASLINPLEYAMYFTNSKNVLVGGPTPAHGNNFNSPNIYFEANKPNDNGYITITNNTAGVNTDGTVPNISVVSLLISIKNVIFEDDYKNDYDVTIVDNKIAGQILLHHVGKHFRIQGNEIFKYTSYGGFMGTDHDSKVQILGCTGGGIIGGESPAEQNNFYNTAPMQHYNQWYYKTGSVFVVESPKVLIPKNRVTCTADFGAAIQVQNSGQPHCQVDYTVTGFVRGKATPNSKIEVFKDDDCWACEGIILLGETISDANGDWSFSGSFSGVVIATATKDGSTSGYSAPTFDGNNVQLIHPTCNEKNGAIRGLALGPSVDNVEWHQSYFDNGSYKDSIISKQVDLENVGAGSYYFVAKLGATCNSYKIMYTLKDYSPRLNVSSVITTQPSCGKNNGAIRGLYLADYYEPNSLIYKWEDVDGNTLATGDPLYSLDLENIGPGRYRLIVTDKRAFCADTSAWYSLVNAAGPSIDDADVVIAAVTCGNNTGSIMGLKYNNAQGALYMEWQDEQGQIVSTSLDLTNQPAGNYRFRFKDEGGCDTITTAYFSIPSSGLLTIDESNMTVTATGCSKNNGNIQGIQVTGANTLSWINLSSQTYAGSSADIGNLPIGDYQLTARNVYGCESKSSVINVPPSTFPDIKPVKAWIIDGNCSESNGWLKLEGFTHEAALQSYYWINSNTGQELGTGLSITGLGAGTYEFVATDTNGCQASIFKANLIINIKPVINTSAVVILPDQCDLETGSITGISIAGLIGPTQYQWTNSSNVIVGNEANLLNAGSGSYRLLITDNLTCTMQAGPFIIGNNNISSANPQYNNITIPKLSAATLNVKNPQPGTYSLYSDAAGTQLLQQNTTGQFTTPVLSEDKVFYIRHQSGNCYSELVAVRVIVVDKSFFAIPSAFTPNGDGKNDLLTLQVIGYIEVNYFKIFNRNGEEIFSSKTIGQSWDGRRKGQLQPGGVYIWMAEGKGVNGQIIRDKGSIVLIR
ncbi:MAG: gliding motility-associated C-terminal domain-containing protein [Chitinophagaceae bacterium]